MSFNIETKCVQSGYTPKNGEPRVVPIVQSTTYKYESSEQMGRLFDLQESGYFYTRLQNPTNDCVAAKIADLEGGVGAMLTSSGQAASFFSVFNICSAGDHVVAASAIYGGTFNLFNVTMRKLGIDFTFVRPDATEEELNAAFKDNTKAVFAETISNPSLVVLDIEKYARAAHSHGVPLIVDNTFPTPINCRPFEFGADIVTHSTTKYMDGHATSVGGVIVDSGNFDWTQNDKFPGLTTPERVVPRCCIHRAVRQGCIYNKVHYPAHARPRLDSVPDERIPAQPRARDSASAYAAPLLKRSHRCKVPEVSSEDRVRPLSAASRATNTMTLRRSICPTAPAASFR